MPIIYSMEWRRNRVVKAAGLLCRKSPEGREFETGLRHPATEKLFVHPAVNIYIFFRIREG